MHHGVLWHDVFDGVFVEGPRVLGMVVVFQSGEQIFAARGRAVQILAEQCLPEFLIRGHARGFGGFGEEQRGEGFGRIVFR